MSERSDDRGDAQWLLARERGSPVPPEAGASVARYARLESLIASLPAIPADCAPAPGWQQRLATAIEAFDPASGPASGPAGGPALASPDPASAATPPSSDPAIPVAPVLPLRRRRWAVPAVLACAVAAAVLVIVIGRLPSGDATGPVLALEIKASADPHRTADPSVRDRLVVHAESATAGEVRVYDDAGAELARCGSPAPDCRCGREGGRFTFELLLQIRAPGALRAVLFSAPLAGPSHGMDGDVAAARTAGITVTTREPATAR